MLKSDLILSSLLVKVESVFAHKAKTSKPM